MILIALGSNLPSQYGSSEKTLQEALRVLGERGLAVGAVSAIWTSAPVPVSDQPLYKNSVAVVCTDLPLLEILELLKGVEREFGRESAERNAARVLDLDLIAYHDEVFSSDDLTVPHPRMQDRAFVLCPLQEVAPDWIHPVLKRSIHDLILGLPEDQRADLSCPEAV